MPTCLTTRPLVLRSYNASYVRCFMLARIKDSPRLSANSTVCVETATSHPVSADSAGSATRTRAPFYRTRQGGRRHHRHRRRRLVRECHFFLSDTHTAATDAHSARWSEPPPAAPFCALAHQRTQNTVEQRFSRLFRICAEVLDTTPLPQTNRAV